MSQKPWQSLVEALMNTLTGVILSLLSVQYIFPLFGVQMDLRQNAIATSIMTIVSVARSYLFRRLFNYLHGRK